MILTKIMDRVGWGEPSPIAALILCLKYAEDVNAPPWQIFLVMIGLLFFNLLLFHMIMKSEVNGTWRSLVRSICTLTLSIVVILRMTAELGCEYRLSITVVIISCIVCTLDSRPTNSFQTLMIGLINWGAIGSALSIYLFPQSPQKDLRIDNNYDIDNDSEDNSKQWIYLTFAMNVLASPIQDVSIGKGLIWQLLCIILFFIFIFNNVGRNNIIISSHQSIIDPNNNNVSDENAMAILFLLIPCIMLAQRSIFWYSIIPPIFATNKNNSDISRQIRLLYCMAWCSSLALCSIFYKPLEEAILICHFVLHWLAHICRGFPMMARYISRCYTNSKTKLKTNTDDKNIISIAQQQQLKPSTAKLNSITTTSQNSFPNFQTQIFKNNNNSNHIFHHK